jgi:hypothetical protein
MPAISVCWGWSSSTTVPSYSIHDQFTERSLVYLAEDFTELTPFTLSSLYQPKDVGVTSAAGSMMFGKCRV